MIYHSGGGFNHKDVYNMPVYLRNFYYKQLLDTKEEEAKQAKKARNQQNKKSVSRSNINPRFKR